MWIIRFMATSVPAAVVMDISAESISIVLCLKENFFVTDDRTLYVYVMIGFQSDVFRTDQPRVFNISRLCEDILTVESPCVLECVLGLNGNVL